MANQELRVILKEKKIPLWKIADEVGVCEMTIIRWFRKQLSDEQYNKVQKAIEAINRKDV